MESRERKRQKHRVPNAETAKISLNPLDFETAIRAALATGKAPPASKAKPPDAAKRKPKKREAKK
jgi:hypothetical protein